jgi:hypothetical protein
MVSGNKRFLGYGLQPAHWAWEAVRNLEMKVVQFRPSPFVLAPNCAALPTKGLRGHARDFGELWDSGKLVCVYDVMTRLAKKPPSKQITVQLLSSSVLIYNSRLDDASANSLSEARVSTHTPTLGSIIILYRCRTPRR